MHIHISKEPLTLLTIGKMSEFLNKETNSDFLKFIAGREPNHYCRQDTNRTVTYPFVFGRDSERYNVLNLCNEATIEIRAFKTPESFEEFAAKLQFAEALTEYCMPCSVSKPLKELTEASSFIQWVKQAGKQYKYLNNFIKGTY
jgi:hypothetical protein